jgi:hypothetical protein
MVIITWALPALIFFITMFGWRHFNKLAPQDDFNTVCYSPFHEQVVFMVVHCFIYWPLLYIMCCFYVIIFYKVSILHKKLTDFLFIAAVSEASQNFPCNTRKKFCCKNQQKNELTKHFVTCCGQAVVEINPNPKDGAQSKSSPGKAQTTAPNSAEGEPLFLLPSLDTDPTLPNQHVQNSIELLASSKAEDRYTCESTAQVLPGNNHENQWSQKRARRALVTATLILGAFVICCTPWWMVQAILLFPFNNERLLDQSDILFVLSL